MKEPIIYVNPCCYDYGSDPSVGGDGVFRRVHTMKPCPYEGYEEKSQEPHILMVLHWAEP